VLYKHTIIVAKGILKLKVKGQESK